MVKDVVTETQGGGLTEIRMSEPVLEATLAMRQFPVRGGLRERRRRRPSSRRRPASWAGCGRRCASGRTSSSTRRIIETEGLDVAARDFLAGMTDRFAVTLFERLFIPKPWIGPMAWNQL